MSQPTKPGATIRVSVNGQNLEVAATSNVRQLLQQLGLPQRGIAVEIDGKIVPKGEWDVARLDDGARMELVQMVGGGA